MGIRQGFYIRSLVDSIGRTHRRKVKYPFHAMEIGETFDVENERLVNAVKVAACLYGKRTGTRFVTTIFRGPRGGFEKIRVQRVE